MARTERRSVPTLSLSNPISNAERRQLSKKCCSCDTCRNRQQKSLDQHWELCTLPNQAKALLVGSSRPVDLRAIARFWAQRRLWSVPSYADASWFLSLGYLKLGKKQEAQNLALNAFFLEQCLVSNVALLSLQCTDLDMFLKAKCLHSATENAS